MKDATPERRTAVPGLTVTQDNEFFFAAAREGRLEIQRCADCETLRHPPGPACPACRSFAWDTVTASGRCTLHSWTVVHHPQDPAFTYPLAVGLVDLEEGTRLVADISGVDHDDLRRGLELEVGFAEHAHGEMLPQLRPAGGAR
ncbi:Zn-ribbon domain-containing OB-fold protein [Nocardioides nitrophenolicus]|uniref:Zn-ribbon domain-containing OB-fold protein n=1 Tax=Nocardioides nitrophenolicus TaxID=60489 RepID=UPI00195A60E1|nr:OB-fold domain-containing protein [Nocardioides nitrophenolicus]MBM7519637.1 putative OB-fold protein [Nocardioides nitrophenolicus]